DLIGPLVITAGGGFEPVEDPVQHLQGGQEPSSISPTGASSASGSTSGEEGSRSGVSGSAASREASPCGWSPAAGSGSSSRGPKVSFQITVVASHTAVAIIRIGAILATHG